MVNQSFAIPVMDGKLCPHFGHCEAFMIIKVENSKIVHERNVSPPQHHPGAYPNFLADLNVNTIIAGGLGPKAQEIFERNNIEVYLGAQSEDPKKLVEDYLNDTLVTGDNQCDH